MEGAEARLRRLRCTSAEYAAMNPRVREAPRTRRFRTSAWRTPCGQRDAPVARRALRVLEQPTRDGRLEECQEIFEPKRIIVTGGAGFIEATSYHWVVDNQPDVHVVVLDRVTYAGNHGQPRRIPEERMDLRHGDICDEALLGGDRPRRGRHRAPSPPSPTNDKLPFADRSRSCAPTCTARSACWRPRASTTCASTTFSHRRGVRRPSHWTTRRAFTEETP